MMGINKRITICMIIKYGFALIFPILSVVLNKSDMNYLWFALVEVLFIASITDILLRIHKILGYVFNLIAILLMNIQFGVLYWGSTYVSLSMMTNLDSVEALGGKASLYILSIVCVIVFSALPVTVSPLPKKAVGSLFAASLLLECTAYGSIGSQYSPYYSLYSLADQGMKRKALASTAVPEEELEINEFYNAEVSDYISKPEELAEQPNVILIFVEGMSQNIIDDSRDVMPNVANLQESSINFVNYYNHTFATYMGLSGQLYSGYQQNNYDENKLVSLQAIFSDYGYQTTFINTEPENEDFTEYLTAFGYDEVLMDDSTLDGTSSSLSDKTAYELLYNTALEQHEEEEPFFITMYSFGTHVSLDGVYEEFGDGSNALLNRFYDLDVQIGEFLEKFDNSALAEDTVIILTTDHATYQDSDFNTAFPDYDRVVSNVDEIPLSIYYSGVTAQEYDADGRNSLDLTPTILDFLDMTGQNYFLGDSLFTDTSQSEYDTIFESLSSYYCTEGGTISSLTQEQRDMIEENIIKYFALKVADESLYLEYTEQPHVEAYLNDDQSAVILELTNMSEYDTLDIAVWSLENDQDDLEWVEIFNDGEEDIQYVFDLSQHTDKGNYLVHVYGSYEGGESEMLDSTYFIIEVKTADRSKLIP